MSLRLDLEAGDEINVDGPATFKLRHKTGRRAVVEVEAPAHTRIERVRRDVAGISDAEVSPRQEERLT